MAYPIQGRFFEEFAEGEEFESHGRTLTETDLVSFCGFIGDYEPPHADEEFAKKGPLGRRIMQGTLVTSVADGQISRMGLFDGTAIALLACSWDFKAPVFIGDTVRTVVRVAELRPSSKGGRGVVTFAVAIRNQSDEEVVTGTSVMMIMGKK